MRLGKSQSTHCPHCQTVLGQVMSDKWTYEGKSQTRDIRQCSFITAQKMKFSIKDFFSKSDQIRSFLRVWSHLLKISFMENFIFCAVHSSLNCPCFWFSFLISREHFENRQPVVLKGSSLLLQFIPRTNSSSCEMID